MSPLSPRRWAPVVWFIVALGVTMLPPQWLLRPARSVYWSAFAATAGTATHSAASFRSVIDIIRQIRQLTQQNSDLRAANLQLQAQVAHLQEVEHENTVLRGELGFVQANQATYHFVPAQIISRSDSTFLQTVTIDQGSRDGITPDQGVMSQGFVVGRVVGVTDHTASVRLITSSRSQIPIVLTQSRATGLLTGGLAGLTGDQLPNNITVIPGESVVTSDLGGAIPAGLPVGNVEKVLSSPSDFLTQVSINSPIAFSKLETVLVVRSK